MSKWSNLTAWVGIVVREGELWLAITAVLALSGFYWRWYCDYFSWTFGLDLSTIILPHLAVAYAAFCVWLVIRIVNRKERWAKRTLAATIGLPVLYVLSFGPACWISSRLQPSGKVVSAIYLPIIQIMWQGRPTVLQRVLFEYVELGVPRGHVLDHVTIEFH